MPTYLERLYCSSLSSCGFHAVLNLKRLYCSSLSSCGFHAGLYYTAHHWAVAASMPHLSPNNVGRTSSLHYYYLALVVLTYLAYSIPVAVNTSHRSILGITNPGIQVLIAFRLVIWRKWEKLTFFLYSLVRSVLIWLYHDRSHRSVLIDWHLGTHKVHPIISRIQSNPCLKES